MLDVVVGFILVNCQLLSAVFQTEHAQTVIEPFLVDSVLALYLAVVAWRCDADAVIAYLVFLRRIASNALRSGKSTGFCDEYLFSVSQRREGKTVIFLNCDTKLARVRQLALISAAACAGCICLLRQAAIHADETVVQVNKEPGRDATAESRIWAYASTKRAERQIRYFRYEQSRKGACAEKVLGSYKGVVISDGYSGYGILSEATRAGCWAHARRKWIEAMPQGAAQENALATKGLEYCSRLFEVEQKLGDLSDAERQEQRRLLSGPIVSEYYAWLQTIFKPTGKLKKAIVYSLNQKEYLCAFLNHGEIEISNNQVENAIRPIVVGRKNWLFCDTQAGASASVLIFTLLETAKANGLNPEAYLNRLLTVLPERFAADPKASIDDLMPWNQEKPRAFMPNFSDADH